MSNQIRVGYGTVTRDGADIALGIRNRAIDAGKYNVSSLQCDLARVGVTPTEAAIDLFTIALAVQAADLAFMRCNGEDGWTREILVSAEVDDVASWNGVSAELSATLGFLSNDLWTFTFSERGRTARQVGFGRPIRGARRRRFDLACLFSGGLDSCVGAIDLLERGAAPLFISCKSDAAANRAQCAVESGLARYPGFTRVGVGGRFRAIESSEPTQRARSFLFIAAAALVASGIGAGTTIIVPENGLIALNPPLEAHRIGALSTRTTHPHYLRGFSRIANKVGIEMQISNPYALRTKGEMMQQCASQAALNDVAAKTVSCGKANPANIAGFSHCGACVPCIIRRAAFLAWGQKDHTTYWIDVTTGVHDALGLSGADTRAFKTAIAGIPGDIAGAIREIRRSGPLPADYAELRAYAELYRRGMAEVSMLLAHSQTVGS